MSLVRRFLAAPLLSGHLFSNRAVAISTSSSMSSSSVYFGCMKVPFQEGMRDECLQGFEATMGRFYRQQPGYIHYLFGACEQDPNALLGFHVWSDRELFDSLPKDAEDASKLSSIRQSFMDRISGPPGAFITKHSVGDVSSLPTPDLATKLSFDEIMGSDFQLDLSTVPRNDLYFQLRQVKTQQGQAEEYAKGMDAAQGSVYRQQSSCLLYLSGVINEDLALFCSVWKSKKVYELTMSELASTVDQKIASLDEMVARDEKGNPLIEAYDTAYVVGENPFESNTSCGAHHGSTEG